MRLGRNHLITELNQTAQNLRRHVERSAAHGASVELAQSVGVEELGHSKVRQLPADISLPFTRCIGHPENVFRLEVPEKKFCRTICCVVLTCA